MTVQEGNIMIDEICNLIESRMKFYSSALVKLVLVPHEESYLLHSGVITFLDNISDEKEERKEYDKLLFIQKLVEPKRIIKILHELVENKTLKIEGLPTLDADGNFSQSRKVPSGKRWGYLKSCWPIQYIDYRIGGTSLPSEPIAAPELPLYPDGTKAVIDFLNLSSQNVECSVFIQIPDFRVRIVNLKISGRSVTLETSKPLVDVNGLIVKLYADTRGREQDFYSMHSPSLNLVDNCVEYEFEKEFDYILAVIMDKKSGEILDYREYHFSWTFQEGVTIELEDLDINEIIRRGEGYTVEFKQELNEELLKTVVAFLNTEGGLILIGVADDATIRGFRPKIEDQIPNRIISNINPVPKFHVRHESINKKPITIVEIPKGDNKPYSHRQLGVYVRSGSTDRHATRTDLDLLYKSVRFV